jgi:hypothetical protein
MLSGLQNRGGLTAVWARALGIEGYNLEILGGIVKASSKRGTARVSHSI